VWVVTLAQLKTITLAKVLQPSQGLLGNINEETRNE